MATSKEIYNNFMKDYIDAKAAQETLNNTRKAAYNADYAQWQKENPLTAEIVSLLTPNMTLPIYSQMQDAQSIAKILDILAERGGLNKSNAEDMLASTNGLVNM